MKSTLNTKSFPKTLGKNIKKIYNKIREKGKANANKNTQYDENTGKIRNSYIF